jgi:hypothetical protein
MIRDAPDQLVIEARVIIQAIRARVIIQVISRTASRCVGNILMPGMLALNFLDGWVIHIRCRVGA